MKRIILYLCLVLLMGAGLGGSPAGATEYNLFELAFNVDGTIYDNLPPQGSRSLSPPLSLPSGLNSAGFDFSTGLGTLVWTTSTPGYHKFLSFFDHEIDETTNTYFNEIGKTYGPLQLPPPGPWYWQIDEPGYTVGDIYNEFLVATFENENKSAARGPDDVSMGIGRDFTLASGEMAILSLVLTTNEPVGHDALWQFDPDSNNGAGASIYLYATFATVPTVVPLPGTLLLLGSGLAAMAGLRLKLRK